MTQYHQITSEIFQIGGQGFTSPSDAAIYMICFDHQAAIIDSGCGAGHDRLLSNIDACTATSKKIKYLLLTHCHYDHTGGAKAIKQSFNCSIVAHELDSPFLESGDNRVTAASWYGASIDPISIDIKLSGPSHTLNLGNKKIDAIHMPGHSPGSVVYAAESDGLKVVFAQDVHGPLDPSLLSNRSHYLASLKRLLEMDIDVLCEGHFGVFTEKSQIQRFIRSYLNNS